MLKRFVNKDLFLLLLVLFLFAGLPLGIRAYDKHVWKDRIPKDAKVFTLTANSRLGWIPGNVSGIDMLELDHVQPGKDKLVLEVNRGDQVVFKLTSSDVIHGFSLKDFGIFIEDGIRPGEVTLVSFKADKAGTFSFSCNIICGNHHENMQGTLIVRA